MSLVFSILDIFLFVILGVMTLYLFVFAIASLKKRNDPSPTDVDPKKFAVLIPAYKEDTVIMDCVSSCLQQSYPGDMYEVVVIADGMKPDTLSRLSSLTLRVIEVTFEKSTKAKALNMALGQLSGFDAALVLDADNIIEPLFLQRLNAAFLSGAKVVQAHRIAKNQNTDLAVLDAVSEEINNSIFRKGHVNLGFSSALIGSGMAFEFSEFKKTMAEIYAVGGFDKELEHTYFLKGIKIHYLQNAFVRDEKIQRSDDYSKQRRRWISAQFTYLLRFLPHLPEQLLKGNRDFCDKLFQMALLPRIMLLGGLFFSTFFFCMVSFSIGLKWIFLSAILIFSLIISVPRELVNRQLCTSILAIPSVFFLTLKLFFKLKGANKEFIHTHHG